MQRGFRSRSLRFLLVGLAATLSVIVLLGASGQAATEQRVRTYRHPTGLQVLVGEYREPGKVPDAFSATLGAAEQLAESAPGQFGQPWFYRTSKTVVLDVATARGAAMAEAALSGDVRAAASLARPSAAGKPKQDLTSLSTAGTAGQLRRRTVQRSWRTLQSIKEELTDLASLPAFRGDNLWMSRIDAPSNRVIVTVSSLSDGLATTIASRYGTSAVAVEVDQDETRTQPVVGRWADNTPFYGGSRLSLGCTDAFSWHSGSTSMMLTAGHCIPNGGSLSTMTESLGSVASGTRENWSTATGTQYLVNDLSGTNVYRGDMALATVYSGKSSAGRIYRGNSESTSSAPVTGMFSRRAQSGDQFCTGGSSRKSDGSAGPGEICGWTVDVARVNYQYATGHWWRNIIRAKSKQGWCDRPGDSGAPSPSSTAAGA